MKTNPYIVFLFLAQVLFLADCKKKILPGIAYSSPLSSYVIGSSPLSVYASPDLSTKPILTLSNLAEFKIIEHGIINQAYEKIRWFKIQRDKMTGYLSEQVLEKSEISSFEDLKESEVLSVSANSLQLRKSPSLKGIVIASLPQNTKVTILARGNLLEKIEEKQDHWVQVKTAEGKTGFCFQGFLIGDLNEKWNEEIAAGFIEIKNPKSILKTPDGEKLKEEEPKEGEERNYFANVSEKNIFPIKKKATVQGKAYYFVSESYLNGCNIWGGCEVSGRMEFWIPTEDTEYFTKSIADYTFQKYGYENESLFQYAKAKLGGNIDVRNIDVEPIGQNSEGIAFSILNVKFDSSFKTQSNYDYKGILQLTKGKYSEVSEVSNEQSVKLHDFDKDGIPEIMLESSGRMSTDTIYYTIKNKKLTEILRLTTGDPDNDATSHLVDDKITYSRSFRDEQTGEFTGKTETITYVYKKGKFVKEKG